MPIGLERVADLAGMWCARAVRRASALPVLALAAMLAQSRCELDPESGALRLTPPGVVSGDEPHYLMVVNSILFDRDQRLEDDYGRVEESGLDAGRRFRCVRRRRPRLRGIRTQERSLRQPGAVVERGAHPIGFPLAVAGLLALARIDQKSVLPGETIVARLLGS